MKTDLLSYQRGYRQALLDAQTALSLQMPPEAAYRAIQILKHDQSLADLSLSPTEPQRQAAQAYSQHRE